ncbi:MAG: hypothetical protein QM771_04860 [Nitrospira sp.]
MCSWRRIISGNSTRCSNGCRTYGSSGSTIAHLKTFSTDLGVTLRLAKRIPAGRLIVSESGIHTRKDVERLVEAGVHAMLIGESLIRAQDTGAKIRELLGDQPTKEK